jgi:hypothetical protein
MAAEVALLSRNIVIRGADADNSSTPVVGKWASRVTGFASLDKEEFGGSVKVLRVLITYGVKNYEREYVGQVCKLSWHVYFFSVILL